MARVRGREGMGFVACRPHLWTGLGMVEKGHGSKVGWAGGFLIQDGWVWPSELPVLGGVQAEAR